MAFLRNVAVKITRLYDFIIHHHFLFSSKQISICVIILWFSRAQQLLVIKVFLTKSRPPSRIHLMIIHRRIPEKMQINWKRCCGISCSIFNRWFFFFFAKQQKSFFSNAINQTILWRSSMNHIERNQFPNASISSRSPRSRKKKN